LATAINPLGTVLLKLQSERSVAKSAVGKQAYRQMASLFASGAVVEIHRGNGRSIEIANITAFTNFRTPDIGGLTSRIHLTSWLVCVIIYAPHGGSF
jgi:hypothetical protein